MVAIVYMISEGQKTVEMLMVDYVLISLSVMVCVAVWWMFLALTD